MYCRNCANQLDDRAVACTKCGLPPRAGNAFCPNCGKPTATNAVICTSCGVPLPGHGGMADPLASNKVAAGVCGILLGALGIHKFILGYPIAGLIMLLVTIVGGWFTCFFSAYAMALVGLIEGIIYLTKTDADFVQTYVRNRREWF